MLDITIVAFGKIKETHLEALASEYVKRLKPYARIRIEELKSKAFVKGEKEAAKKEEGLRLQDFLSRKKSSSIFLMAEKGEEFDSSGFANKLDSRSEETILVIGGALGFSKEIFNLYPKLSLSKLTFPHELARVILLEQIYRTVTILNRKDYHY